MSGLEIRRTGSVGWLIIGIVFKVTPSRPRRSGCSVRRAFFVSTSIFGLLPLIGCPADQPGSAALPAQAMAPALPAPQARRAAPQPVLPTVAQASQQAQPQATARPSAAEQQRVRVIIEQVEAAYAAGDADYRKGMLAEAKVQFDRAVDLLLSSGIDIKSDPQLQEEFDKIVDQVNGLEMEALKQGNGFVPKEEITPAEAASDVTFAVDPNLVAKATAELATTKSDLPLMVNDYVAAFINFFAYTQKGHNTLEHSFERSGHYKTMIQRVLADEGMPQDLIYLAVAESGFNPRAIGPRTRSGAHAGGMWQFMPDPVYGLKRDNYVDERFDPEKSTRAYARYMKFLHDQLGDWYLAMAAYDWGAGSVQHAVQKTGYADFWELYKRNELPTETRNYVPEILAAIIIANNPHQYGFDDVTLDPPVLTDTVTIDYSVDLRLVSDMVGAPVDEIEALNPSLLRLTTPPDTSFDLHLPAGTATLFEQRVSLVPETRRNSWRYHTVASGDTLATVAQEYRVPVAELASANQLTGGDSLSGVEALVVPVPLAAEPMARVYTVRRGDTLVTIADRFGVSLSQLRRWNNIPSGTRVDPGRRLHVAEPPAPVRTSATHRRKSGASTSSSAPRTSTPASERRSGSGKSGSNAAKPAHTQASKSTTHTKSSTAHKAVGTAHRSQQ
jgi:membrane-bound lytic murein transglycosylase D